MSKATIFTLADCSIGHILLCLFHVSLCIWLSIYIYVTWYLAYIIFVCMCSYILFMFIYSLYVSYVTWYVTDYLHWPNIVSTMYQCFSFYSMSHIVYLSLSIYILLQSASTFVLGPPHCRPSSLFLVYPSCLRLPIPRYYTLSICICKYLSLSK